MMRLFNELVYRPPTVPPTYCTAYLLYHLTTVPSTYCTAYLLYRPPTVPVPATQASSVYEESGSKCQHGGKKWLEMSTWTVSAHACTLDLLFSHLECTCT